jgi:hypothetical protein
VSDSATGNPVFDFRAEFRRRAATAQFVLTLGGMVLLIGSGVCRLAHFFPQECVYGAAGGMVSLCSGVAWGFYWRRSVRADFRRLFGPPAE